VPRVRACAWPRARGCAAARELEPCGGEAWRLLRRLRALDATARLTKHTKDIDVRVS
jgi:hypothetical protein